MAPIRQVEGAIPGKSNYYATVCGGCSAACGVLTKNRDGRPIKLEGNPEHPVSLGGLCAIGQASVLGLYDSQRLKHPLREGAEAAWEEVDRTIIEQLDATQNDGGAVRFLTATINSPTTMAAIAGFLGRFSDARHVVYDPLSNSAVLDAHEQTFGARLLPRYRFDMAEVIISFDADFLGTWISPVEYTAGFRAGRNLEAKPPRSSYHVQFGSRMSLTGSKADQRIRTAPGALGPAMTQLAAAVATLAGETFESTDVDEISEQLAARLWNARGRSLVVCGSQDVGQQRLCNYINHLLGNYGSTVDIERPSHQSAGSDRDLRALLGEIETGGVAGLFISGVNPVFDLPEGDKLAGLIEKVPLVVSFAERLDETAEAAGFVCPDSHYLESWGDREPVRGVISLLQPCSAPLGGTRQLIESLSAWGGDAKPAYDIVREHWQNSILPRAGGDQPFEEFWDHAVHDGVVEIAETTVARPLDAAAVRPVTSPETTAGGEYSLVLYPKVGLRDGRHAYNPWLHELPDPITKVTWDNYACLAPATAENMGVGEGDVVRVAVGETAIELPVVLQPGQHEKVVAVALGYGSKATERFATIGPRWIEARSGVGSNGRVGTNAAPLLGLTGAVTIEPTGARHPLAATQQHHHLEVPEHLAPRGGERRPVIQETTFPEHYRNVWSGAKPHEEHHPELWPEDHPYDGHHWAMAIDLNACTGCSGCVVACQAENNISVVGKDEVRRQREMHWLRIDRYYSGHGDDVEVAHQPMMCQQCDNAPCETVCPVLATVHSKEGLNQQIYNRCVGTRYCANNCPYKVRRFNWFEYAREDSLENLVLNPDVTVRSRGVMEKCSFCVQRIQEARIQAKGEGRELRDGEIQTACQQSCPANAIVFGDKNDPNSKVSALLASSRRYEVLEEINVKPSVGYLKLVRQRSADKEGERHG
ncbi:MAG: 4Fe-4S dicluster domain-containing protein [bacterium]|nr:4Fe-4S dicluster domain-containing protein [bacterium]